MKYELTGELLPFPHLTPLDSNIYMPSSHPSLVPATMSPDFGLSHRSEAGLAWVTVAQFAVCASVVKSISWWLEQSWIPPWLYHL